MSESRQNVVQRLGEPNFFGNTKSSQMLETSKRPHIIEYGSTLYVGMTQKKMAAPLNVYKI